MKKKVSTLLFAVLVLCSPLFVGEARVQETKVVVPGGGVVTLYHSPRAEAAKGGATVSAVTAATPGRVIAYLPRFAAGPGWYTEITASDVSSVGSGAGFYWYNDSGSRFGLTTQETQWPNDGLITENAWAMGVSLGPNSTSTLRLLCATKAPTTLTAGWILVDAQEDLRYPGSGEPGAEITAIFFRVNDQGLVTGQAIAPLTYPTTAFSVRAQYSDGVKPSQSGISLMNPDGAKTATATLTLVADGGGDLYQTTLPIGPRCEVARFLAEFFPKVAGTKLDGRLRVASDVPVVGLALFFTGDGVDMSFSSSSVTLKKAP